MEADLRFESSQSERGAGPGVLSRVLVFVCVAAGVAATAALGATTTGYPLDDTWIHLDYARSLVESQTFGYMAGTWENGSTAPLWSLLIAIPLALGVAPTLAAKLVGMLALLFLVFFVHRVTAQIGCRVSALLAALLVALDPWISVLAVSGMEPVAAGAAGFAATYFLLCGRAFPAGVALAAAGLLRPEMGVLLPILVLGSFAPSGTARRRPSVRWWLSLVGPPLAAGGAWMLYGVVVTGRALPNAFWLKTHGDLDILAQFVALKALLFAQFPIATAIVGLISLLGLRRLYQRDERQLWLLVMPVFTILAAYVFRLPLGRDRGPMAAGSAECIYFARYVLLVLPWLLTWIALGATFLVDLLRGWFERRSSTALATKLSLGVALALGALVVPSWQGHRLVLWTAYRANCAEIQDTQVALAHWIDSNLAADAVLGVSDAGAQGFYARGRKVIDLMGLNSHQMLAQPNPLQWLEAQGVTHVVVWPQWHRWLFASPHHRLRRLASVHNDNPTIVAEQDLVVFQVEHDH